MLKQLFISNYALLDEVIVDFPGKLTVITGETGAGKSILLGALGLILGERGDSNALNDKKRKCIVEGTFDIRKYELKVFFEEHELDYAEETRLRRELTPEGKSRAFINDTPVNLQTLRSLGERLIDIHSQHENLFLSKTQFRTDVLDAFSGLENDAASYRKLFVIWREKQNILNELQAKQQQLKKDQDYYSFQFQELQELGLVIGDQENWEMEAVQLENAELIRENLLSSSEILDNAEVGVLQQLGQIKKQMQALVRFGSDYEDLFSRLNALIVEAKTLVNDFQSRADKVNAHPEALQNINEKLDKLNRLLKKHGVKTDAELLTVQTKMESYLQGAESIDSEIEQLEKELKDLRLRVLKMATSISTQRMKHSPLFEQKISETLSRLKMPNARFKVELEQLSEPDASGIDKIRFLFCANAGSEFRELHKVASGGELSRLMLSIKALIARLTSLPSIIFDEIDTGVSGETGAKIGDMLEEMSQGMQVISITHLPQIASKGNHHLFVFKKDEQKKTTTHIKELGKKDRVTEIAKMLSAGEPGAAALKNAEELLNK
jgi:DNA repair protein RecN (Recombination protein N)